MRALSPTFIEKFRLALDESIKVYVEYLEGGGEKYTIPEKSSDWSSGPLIRASSMSSCPKKHAAERTGAVEKFENTWNESYRFWLANIAAQGAKEAILHMVSSTQKWSAKFEERVLGAEMAGTMDVQVGYKVSDEETVYLPVEIKRTDADQYEGITDDQVWQTIAYMELCDSAAGFLFAMYDGKKTKQTHKVWSIVRCDEGWTVLDDGLPFIPVQPSLKFGGYIGDDGSTTFSDSQYLLFKSTHKAWYDLFTDNPEQALNAKPPFTDLQWQCAHVIPIAYYQVKYTNKQTGEVFKKGDQKPNTGISTPRCPLFSSCWPEFQYEREES